LGAVLEQFVIRQNIEHYQELLKITSDPAERQRIERLLLDEQLNLRNTTKITKRNNASSA
jgi:hypothetical protein